MMVIYDGDGRFWSNLWGWGSLEGAERFTLAEARGMRLPMAETRPARYGANSAQWLDESDARIIASRRA
jgi:hypothetical protein